MNLTWKNIKRNLNFNWQANLAVQEARLNIAMGDLQTAQAQLDEKEAELAKVRALYDQAMAEKQVLPLFNW